MKLILTEKPNVTKQIKNVLAPKAQYIRCGGKAGEPLGYYEDTEYVICNTVGHCVNIKNPRDINDDFTWSLSKLPYAFPKELPLEISKGKEALFDVIQTCFSKYDYDEIIIATDGDREGQNIWRKIRLMLKPFKSKEVNRVWLSEWTPEGIKDAFDNRFPNSDKKTLEDAAQCREEDDYIIGMNCTVALTKKYAVGKGNVTSIGRVMGPTMFIVYSREKEIQNFKPEVYTTLAIKTNSEDKEDLLLKMKRQDRLSASVAKSIEAELKKVSTVVLNKEDKKVYKRCPELYDATTIAQDMNKRFGFSAKKTSDIIQKLYQDYALTTYPGTNARKISVGSAKKVYQILNNLTIHNEIIDEIKANKWNVSNHIITTEGLAHEAITPVYGSIDKSKIARLTADEMKVYKAIIERFLAVFYPKAEFEEVIISTSAASENFEAKGKVLLNAGWMKVLGMPTDTMLPRIIHKKSYMIKDIVKENKKTVPPSRYNEDTLLSAMKNAGRFVADSAEAAILNSKEVEGLGTGRTRPAIIENIKNKGYFVTERKQIIPTQKCMDLFAVLPNTTLSSPSLTAKFEQMIQDVEDGNMIKQDFFDKIDKEVVNIIDLIKNDISGNVISSSTKTLAQVNKENIGVCPICGNVIIESDKAFGCANWKAGCKFTIWKNQRGKTLTKSQVKSLISKGKTPLIKGFENKLGKSYDAVLTFEVKSDGTYDYLKSLQVDIGAGTMNPVKASIMKKEFGTCPYCGNPMYEDKDKYFCENCKTKLYKNGLAKLGKKNIGKKEARKLLDGETIEVELISQKTNNPYKAKAYYDNTTGWVKISFK